MFAYVVVIQPGLLMRMGNVRGVQYEQLAAKAKRESDQAYEYSTRLSEAIPFGQPILVGHHSERHHRKDLERIHNSMDKSIELSKQAEVYEHKVENILNPKAISSDDPEAITKLKVEIEGLEKSRDLMKKINSYFRKNKTFEGLDVSPKIIEAATKNMACWKDSVPFPGYEFSNISGNIRAKKLRIEQLEKLKSVAGSEEQIGDITLKVDVEDNRVKLIFPGKPSEEVRDKLKSNGFRWSPYNGCWQRMINDWAIQLARDIAKEMDLDLSKPFIEVYKKAFDIAECCGYWVAKKICKEDNIVELHIGDGYGQWAFVLYFDGLNSLCRAVRDISKKICSNDKKEVCYVVEEIPKYPGYKNGF
jgi:hypothetical protein